MIPNKMRNIHVLTEQFIHGLDDEGTISEIWREVSVIQDIDDATSEWILLRAQRVKAQRHKRKQWIT